MPSNGHTLSPGRDGARLAQVMSNNEPPDAQAAVAAANHRIVDRRLREAAELLVDALLDRYLEQRRAQRIAEHEVAREVPTKEAPRA